MLVQTTFYSRVFGLVVAALLGYALFQIFAPFFNAMSWAVFLAFLLYPLNLRLRRRLHRSARAAGVLTVLTPIVVLLPLSALSVEFVAQVSALVRMLQQRARALDRGRSADHDHEVNAVFPAGLKKQRHVDDNEATARGRGSLDKVSARLGNRGMHQPFKTLQRLCVTQHLRPESIAINLA